MDIRQEITDSIVQAIENGGTPPWRKSWSSGYLHCNASSGVAYKGINQLILAMAAPANGDVRWLTYKLAGSMGLQVRKGKHGTVIVKMVEVNRRQVAQEAKSGGDVLAEDGAKALIMKAFTVFHASQIDGMAPMPTRECNITCADVVEQIIFGLQRTGLKVNFGQGFQPAYYPRRMKSASHRQASSPRWRIFTPPCCMRPQGMPRAIPSDLPACTWMHALAHRNTRGRSFAPSWSAA